MNAEIIKAMNRKNEKHPVRDWWKKNGYKVLRVVLFPVWGCMWAGEKIKNKMNAPTKFFPTMCRASAHGMKKIRNFTSLIMAMAGL